MTVVSIIIIIVATLFLSALFSGMEIAYISANRLRMELNSKRYRFSAPIVSYLLKRPSQYISTMLIGNNIALVIYGIIMEITLAPWFYHWTDNSFVVLLLQTIISTFIILLFAEFLPKVVFSQNANTYLRIFAVPIFIFYLLFFPIAIFIIGISNLILRLFGIKSQHHNQLTYGKIDLDYLVNEYRETDQQDDENNLRIFQNALDFSTITLRECIVPRTEIEALPITANIDELKERFIESGYSKIIIYEENIDKIIGYVHSSYLFKNPKTIKEILLPISIVPETKPAKDLLSELLAEKKSIAMVVDEFGGTAGIITMEDIIEEITGEIEDEYDVQELTEKKISDTEFLFSGRTEIDYINQTYSLNIPESDSYETLAGFILQNHHHIPKKNEEITISPFRFIIEKVSNVKIELVRLFVDK
jgi:CBS domain containing-hemolysin-like protein